MRTDNGDSVSLWMATADTPDAPALATDVDADVCVVGAGIAGLTTAYLLGREGRRVVVLDDGSRFHRDGHVVQGPANAGLKPVER